MAALSRIYFSAGPSSSDRQAALSLTETPAPALISLLNHAGDGGWNLVAQLRAGLDRTRATSLFFDSCPDGTPSIHSSLSPLPIPPDRKSLSARIEEKSPSIIFVALSDGDGFHPEEPISDLSLLLIGDVREIRHAYTWIKRKSEVRGGRLPVLLPVDRGDARWSRKGAERLAEACVRFLHRRLTIWEETDEAVTRLIELTRRVGLRRHGGAAESGDRLARLAGVARG